MPASLELIHATTPMGATLVDGGATFRVWAPNALAVHVVGADFDQAGPSSQNLLTRDDTGHWRGFVPGVRDRHQYMFWVEGKGDIGYKRDPYARELSAPRPPANGHPAPTWECVVRSSDFPWHETGYVTPPFHEFVIYQLHVGSFFTPRLPAKAGTFLDVALKVPYLAELGVTAIQLLPIQEFQTVFSMGYNGTDYFSPEMDFAVSEADLAPYLAQLNALLTAKGLAPYSATALRGEMNQLKALIDLCHVYGLAVIFDVVFNHAGGDFGDESLYRFDRQSQNGGHKNSLYFSEIGHAGGLVFDFAKPEVRDFLINNGRFLLDEYRIDGLRYDQVSVIDHDGSPHGWRFIQDLTSTLQFTHPGTLAKAEYWGVNPHIVRPVPDGAGFDTSLTDGLRIVLRNVIEQASQPDTRPLPMSALARSLWPDGFAEHWRFVQGPENHDIVYRDREPRIAKLADPGNPRSWFGRSRARVATGLSLTAPGIPMLFMGQEYLEDKSWADDIQNHANLLLHWAGIERGDKQMLDHVRCIRELLHVRANQPALRSDGFRVIHADDQSRVLAFQRWVPGHGQDVVVIAHLSTTHQIDYRIGFPASGYWREIYNSDVYESWVNPSVVGNHGGVEARPEPMHGSEASAALVLPANSLLLFAR
jgi:1,4-alpha-glucan branching enzyme